MVAIGDDVKGLLDFARPLFALYIGGMGARGKNFYNDLACQYGYEKEAKEIQDLYLDGKKKEAEAAVPLELLEQANLVGPESYVKERIEAFRESGVTNLQITPASDDPAGAGAPAQGMGELTSGRCACSTCRPTAVAPASLPRTRSRPSRTRSRSASAPWSATCTSPPTAYPCSATNARTPASSSAVAHRWRSWLRSPRLHDLVDLLEHQHADEVGLNVETKFDVLHPDEDAPRERFVETVLEVLREPGMLDRTSIQSFDWAVLRLVRAADARIALNALTNTDYLEVDQPGASPWLAGLDIDDFHDSVPAAVSCARLRRDLAQPHDPDPGDGRGGPRGRPAGAAVHRRRRRLDAPAGRVRGRRDDHQPPRRSPSVLAEMDVPLPRSYPRIA